MGMFSESVDVACTPAGQPLRLAWNGRDYTVCAEPVRWYERRQWWAEEQRAPLGSGPGLVDHEIWRVQVRPAASRDTESLTLDLSRHVGSGRWRLVRIHDALLSFRKPESA
ncbi:MULTISPECIES: DUF6504 family protein [unclassified Arthrobacter]|uniref:DUF6504 family protein n=1 Tax=unclassified Arthrobacter TaxID=235627 RepID=UPI002E087B2E|nr:MULTISPECIES: DUF6504 family protein [unclassified Arthrobacter]MEC5192142.1 hypothetical protein [Arthrobacter sp. MP_M4]MEC5203251.1 hypothetical protein [Arthrobacter sp. MP_M7]